MAGVKLGSFLQEVSNWRWDEFCLAEKDNSYTSNQAVIFALIRACAMQKLDAIKLSLDRIDGKLKTPIRIEAPKIYYLYPNAAFEKPITNPNLIKPGDKVKGKLGGELMLSRAAKESEEPELDLPSMSLRETLGAMADTPRELPEAVIQYAEQAQQWVLNQGEKPHEIPMVKSVVAAHLLVMAASRDIGALSQVFDQIDGKLAETIQIIGEDMYITNFSTTAPEGAYLNDDGVLQTEATQTQNLWAVKLGATLDA